MLFQRLFEFLRGGKKQPPPSPGPKSARERSSARVGCDLTVSSPQLPGQRVKAVDLSKEGLQAEVSGRMAIGALALLEIEFDTERLPKVTTEAAVQWCSQVEDDRFRVGLQFLSLDPKSQETVGTYRELLKMRQHFDL